MSRLCTEAPRVVSPQSSLLNYLYLLHFHIMAVSKSNKQSKAYNKGRGQEGAGTFFLPFLNSGKGRASHIKSTEFGSQESLRGLVRRRHQSVWRLPPWWGFKQLCVPVWLLICHIETYGGMQAFLPPRPKYVCENSLSEDSVLLPTIVRVIPSRTEIGVLLLSPPQVAEGGRLFSRWLHPPSTLDLWPPTTKQPVSVTASPPIARPDNTKGIVNAKL